MNQQQAIAELRARLQTVPSPRALEVVTSPELQPRELFLQIGRKRYQVAGIREAIDMYSTARDNADHGASRMPRVTIVSNTGLFLYSVSYNGRVWNADGSELCAF